MVNFYSSLDLCCEATCGFSSDETVCNSESECGQESFCTYPIKQCSYDLSNKTTPLI